MRTRCEFGDLFIEVIPVEKRDEFNTPFRYGQESGRKWVGTLAEVEKFMSDLNTMVYEYEIGEEMANKLKGKRT